MTFDVFLDCPYGNMTKRGIAPWKFGMSLGASMSTSSSYGMGIMDHSKSMVNVTATKTCILKIVANGLYELSLISWDVHRAISLKTFQD